MIPLVQGCDFESSKAIVAPGTLQECMNYEVNSLGYERSQGLLVYNGTYDRSVDNMWYIADLDADALYSGVSFDLGTTVTWNGGSGTCVFSRSIGSLKELGLVNIVGEVPDTATVFTAENGETFTLSGSRRGQLLVDPINETYATDPSTGLPIAGTTTDYLAFIKVVNNLLSQATNTTWPHFKPGIPGVGPITGGFQFNDNVYAVKDYYCVYFQNGENEPNIGDTVSIGFDTFMIADYEITAGYFEAGNAIGYLYFRPADGTTHDKASWVITAATGGDIDNVTQSNKIAEVFTGVGFEDSWRKKGLLWKAEREGWKHIDTGYSLRFQNGTNPPNARVTPLYLSESVGAVQNTGWVQASNVAQSGSASFATWSDLANIYADDGAYVTATLAAGQESKVIEVLFSDVVNAAFTDILGIEVRIEAGASANNAVRPNLVALIDNGGTDLGPFQFKSLNLGSNEYLTTVDTNYQYGGQTDLWGFKGKTVEDINDGGLRIRFKVINDDGVSRNVRIDDIAVKVHYVSRGQRVFFYDTNTSADVAEGDIYSFDVHDGSWGGVDNNAFGWMSFHDVDTPSAVVAGLEMRTEASGGGLLIAETNSQFKYNLLPGSAELEREHSKYRTIKANFYENEDGEAIYGTNGVSPLFQFDGDEHFSFIRLPVAPEQDKPRHVQFHKNHLVVSANSHILISVVGSPTDFNTANDAVTFGVRDPITGLQSLPGDAMGILCEESIHALSGTYFNEFQVQNITPQSGAIEYTTADVMGPLFADFNGITNVNTTAAFGDFKTRPYTAAIYKWMSRRHQKTAGSLIDDTAPILSVAVRSKNQYRLYYEDGYIVSLGMPQGSRDSSKPMIGHYDPEFLTTDYVPTWIDSTVLSDGRERVVMGTKDGNVWIVDGANGIQGEGQLLEVPCWFTINPVNLGFIQGAHSTKGLTLYGDFMRAQNITYSVGYDYLPPSSTPRDITLGHYDEAPVLEAEVGYTDIYPKSYTDGFSLKLETTMDGSKPHRFHSLLQRANTKGAGRNNTQKSRG